MSIKIFLFRKYVLDNPEFSGVECCQCQCTVLLSVKGGLNLSRTACAIKLYRLHV